MLDTLKLAAVENFRLTPEAAFTVQPASVEFIGGRQVKMEDRHLFEMTDGRKVHGAKAWININDKLFVDIKPYLQFKKKITPSGQEHDGFVPTPAISFHFNPNKIVHGHNLANPTKDTCARALDYVAQALPKAGVYIADEGLYFQRIDAGLNIETDRDESFYFDLFSKLPRSRRMKSVAYEETALLRNSSSQFTVYSKRAEYKNSFDKKNPDDLPHPDTLPPMLRFEMRKMNKRAVESYFKLSPAELLDGFDRICSKAKNEIISFFDDKKNLKTDYTNPDFAQDILDGHHAPNRDACFAGLIVKQSNGGRYWVKNALAQIGLMHLGETMTPAMITSIFEAAGANKSTVSRIRKEFDQLRFSNEKAKPKNQALYEELLRKLEATEY